MSFTPEGLKEPRHLITVVRDGPLRTEDGSRVPFDDARCPMFCVSPGEWLLFANTVEAKADLLTEPDPTVRIYFAWLGKGWTDIFVILPEQRPAVMEALGFTDPDKKPSTWTVGGRTFIKET